MKTKQDPNQFCDSFILSLHSDTLFWLFDVLHKWERQKFKQLKLDINPFKDTGH